MTPSELFQCYRRGWRIGAMSRAHDPRFTKHPDPAVVSAYERGHEDGRSASLLAMAREAERVGYDPRMSILRSGEEGYEPKDGGAA